MELVLDRLREWRGRQSLSQQQLAAKAGVSQDAISNYETGRRGARPATARKIAAALGVEVEQLVEGGISPASGAARPRSMIRVSAAQTALLLRTAVKMMRLRRQAGRRPPEWVRGEIERRLKQNPNPVERWALVGLERELRREHDRRHGKYRGSYLGYLREKISDEFYDFGWMEALVDASDTRLQGTSDPLVDEDLDEVEEVLDEAQDRIDRLRETIDEYRQTDGRAGPMRADG